LQASAKMPAAKHFGKQASERQHRGYEKNAIRKRSE